MASISPTGSNHSYLFSLEHPPIEPHVMLVLDERSRARWNELGMPAEVADRFPDCVKFLLKSKLIYAMLGFRESSRDRDQHGLRISHDGHPMIKVQGEWMRWEDLKNLIEYDPEEEQIKSKDCPSLIAGIWTYLGQDGLVRVDRLHYDRPFPIFRLSGEDVLRLQVQARRFFETNPETEPLVPKTCVLQFFTSPFREGEQHPLLENFYREYPVHIGIRVITANGDVYSFGYQLPLEEQRQIADDFMSSLLKTGDARIGMLDYEEFRPHSGRYITSIPITSKYAEDVLNRVDALNKRPQLRFNYSRQNCSALMNELMPAAYHVDLHRIAKEVLWGTIPSLHQIPYIGHLIGMVQRTIERIWNTIVSYTPECIQIMFTWLDRIVFAIPRECQTIASNLFLWKLGATTMTRPLMDGLEEEEVNLDGKIQSFSTLLRSWTDFFKDVHVFHSRYFVEWQKRQHSTTFHEPGDVPEMVGLLDFPPVPG